MGKAPLVLAVVGTDHHPFDRLVTWLDEWAGAGGRDFDVLVQYGTSRAPEIARGERMFGWRDMRDLMREAAAVVCAGGPATVMDTREQGKVPIVVPRRHELGEHVDDHQRAFARFLAARGLAYVAESKSELESLLGRLLHDDPAVFRFDPSTQAIPVGIGRFGQVVDDLVLRRD